MSNLTIVYNGSTIFNGELDEEVTLPTDGMYMEDDVTVDWDVGGTDVSSVLNDNEWSVISEVAQAGEGGSYWSVGDTKSVHVQGTVGTRSFNTTYYVYIIGINHRDANGITFLGFKTSATAGTDVCLVNTNYNSSGGYDGTKEYNMNHWGTSGTPYNRNYGGWKGCDLRYDILGSTNTAPSGYGSSAATSRVGYDAGATTTSSPVPNTLMSCLPSDLRAVMQPMIIYTDNKGNSSNTAANVTTSVDYLPLMAEYEVFGVRSSANLYEKDNQSQYAYFSLGNSKIKYRYNILTQPAHWWMRSPHYNSASSFCTVNTAGAASSGNSYNSYGLAPIFLV